jgi:type IV pilus assembly protein PilW
MSDRAACGRRVKVRMATRRCAGFSLVELVLALALGLLVVSGVVQMFAAATRTSVLQSGQARMQENARFAIEIIARAARAAGYFGCGTRHTEVVKGLSGAWDLLPEYDVTRPLQGFDGGTGGGWNPSLDTLPRTEGGSSSNVHIPSNGIDTRRIAPGTDVVVFRSMQSPGQRLVEPLHPNGDPVVTAPGGDPGFGVGDVVMVADCSQGAVFRVTGMSVIGGRATLQHAAVSAGSRYDNASVIESPDGPVPYTLSFSGRPYGADASIGAVESTWFFIAPSAGRDDRGDPVSALWHKVGSARPAELVPGVEHLELAYGIAATAADGVSPTRRYVSFVDLPDGERRIPVVALRVTLTMSSIDGVTEDGSALRRTFGRTIMLRNASLEP